MKINPLTQIDFYKADHRSQYPIGTNKVYSNFTPRSDRLAKVAEGYDHKVVFFGLQGWIKWFLQDCWNENFFHLPKQQVVDQYRRRMDTSLGPGAIDVSHIEALHDLGYLPIRIKAVPEGSRVDMRVPVLTIENTKDEFFWLTNYLESVMSAELWKPCTTATTAYEYRKMMVEYAKKTASPLEFVDFQGHDFSFRGLSGLHDAHSSSAGHLLSFVGTDTVPAIDYLENYYHADAEKELVGTSVPACYDAETEILTEDGFIKFKDLGKNKRVAQYHQNGSVDFVNPSEYYDMPYNGDMIKWSKEGYGYIDLVVTPNHKMVRLNKDKNELGLFEAGDFSYKVRNGYSHRNHLIISGRTSNISDVMLSPMERLRVAFQADGSFPSRSEEYKSGQIRFSLKKERKINRLKFILSQLNLEYSISERDEKGYISFWIKTNDSDFDKDFKWVSLDYSYNWFNDFINELVHWDGSEKNNCIVYSNTNKDAIDKIQAICAISNKKTQLNTYQDTREDCNRKTIYSLCIQKNNKNLVSGNGILREVINYNDRVYCVSVPTKMLIVRRNGVVAICGNTEHSVMCMGTQDAEIETFRRLITELYPTGIVSIVSDTYDFFQVMSDFTVQLKEEILNRQPNALGLAKVVFRPDSGDPVKIICGDPDAPVGTPEYKGACECLWDVFGGTTTQTGHKVLNERVGLIYGDSITLDRCDAILRGLEAKGFASCNIVFGIGSYTYQYCTRDNFGFAMKATYGEVNGVGRPIFKDPKTDNGVKKSAKGLLRVEKKGDDFVLYDEQTLEQANGGVLEVVFEDGRLIRDEKLSEIRQRLR